MGTLAAPAARYLVERRNRQEINRQTAMRISYILLSLDASYGDRSLAMFGTRAIERWSAANPHWGRSTRNTYLGQARVFCRWMLRRKLITADPFADMRLPRRPRPSPKPITRTDIARLIATVPDARARVIVHLQWGLGLRCIGCANLQIENIDLTTKTLYVVEKNGEERFLPVEPHVEAEIDRYLWLFPGSSGPLLRNYTRPWEGLTAKYIGRLVAEWMKEAGVKRRPFDGMSAHGLRRTALTEVAEATGDAFIVQELAGWASPATAAHYVRRASTERVRLALEQRASHSSETGR